MDILHHFPYSWTVFLRAMGQPPADVWPSLGTRWLPVTLCPLFLAIM